MEGTAGCWTEELGTRLPGFCFNEAPVFKVNHFHLQGQLKLDITFQNMLEACNKGCAPRYLKDSFDLK